MVAQIKERASEEERGSEIWYGACRFLDRFRGVRFEQGGEDDSQFFSPRTAK